MKRILLLALCFMVVFTSLASCGKAERPQTAAELLDLGEKYLLELNYEQALVQFLKIIEIDPMDPRGYTGAAEAYIGLGKIDEAAQILEQGLAVLPDNADISAKLSEVEEMRTFTFEAATNAPAELLSFGEKYLIELDYEQAVMQFLKVIEIEPMNPKGYIGAAEAYIGLGQIDNVELILQQGYDKTDNLDILNILNLLPISENDSSSLAAIMEMLDELWAKSSSISQSTETADDFDNFQNRDDDDFHVWSEDDFIDAWNTIAESPPSEKRYTIAMNTDTIITLTESLPVIENSVRIRGGTLIIDGCVSVETTKEYRYDGFNITGLLIVNPNSELIINSAGEIRIDNVINYGSITVNKLLAIIEKMDNYGELRANPEDFIGDYKIYPVISLGYGSGAVLNNYSGGKIINFIGRNPYDDGIRRTVYNEGLIEFDCQVANIEYDQYERCAPVRNFYPNGWNASDYRTSFYPGFGGTYSGNGTIRLYNSREKEKYETCLAEEGYVNEKYYMAGVVGLTFSSIDEYESWLDAFETFDFDAAFGR